MSATTQITRRNGTTYYPRCQLTDAIARSSSREMRAVPMEIACQIGATYLVPTGDPSRPDSWVWALACPHHFVQWQHGEWMTLKQHVAKHLSAIY